ncbi:MAG: 50S ribosomal protein L24 [Verrucomicrobiota bacterium]
MKKLKKRIPLQKKFHVKKGDEVLVISGVHKGKSGKVLEMVRKKNRVIVEGVNLIKKAMRKTQDNPTGGIQEREGTLHLSNVKRVERTDAKDAAASAEAKKPAAKKAAAKKPAAKKAAASKAPAKKSAAKAEKE